MKTLGITLLICIALALALGNYLGFHHVPHHVQSVWSNLNWQTPGKIYDALMQKTPDTHSLEAITDAALPAIQTPIDLLMWAEIEKSGGFIPDGVKDDIERYKKRDFSKLVEAPAKPSNQEVQQTLVRRWGEELITLLKDRDASLRVGKCFNAPLQGDDSARVTCMVSGFNKKGDNLKNVGQPLDTTYDFVQKANTPNVRNPREWYVTDFSQEIPFDYVLNKR